MANFVIKPHFSFERLVKLIGKQLSPVVYKFIIYIEESQKQANEATQAKKKTVNTSAMRTKVLRETRTIPKVIYEMEQFSRSIIQLSNKTKVDLAKHLGQGTARDFRILNLKEVLENQGTDLDNSTQSSVNDTIAQVCERMEVEENAEEAESSDEQIPPKRARI